jgi:hypothetical protein
MSSICGMGRGNITGYMGDAAIRRTRVSKSNGLVASCTLQKLLGNIAASNRLKENELLESIAVSLLINSPVIWRSVSIPSS